MKDQIIKIIKERIETKCLVFPHEAQIDQGPVIRLVMEIPLTEDRGYVLGGFDRRVLDDGYAVVHDPEWRGQHGTVSDETKDNDGCGACEHR